MKQAGLMLFWDYDTQWGADRSRSPGGAKQWGRLDFENTEKLLDAHARYGVSACFAVVGAAALPGERPYHDPAQIRRIHQAGHEIASHSFQHDWIPGLDRAGLLETLRHSKEALEDCIGAPVVTFVPPYNQPFDYPSGGAFSFSERFSTGRERIGLGRLCETLKETGYKFCRVAYRPIHQQIAEFMLKRRFDQPAALETIAGVGCVRLNTPCGFEAPARSMLHRSTRKGGFVVAYGHPHSVSSNGSQSLDNLVQFLEVFEDLRRHGLMQSLTPGSLVHTPLAATVS